jgi:nucleoside-diphosphate-sugar epimerase
VTKKIAVIGGSGFVGGYLMRDLMAAGHEVRNIDIAKPDFLSERWIEADVRDLPALTKAFEGCDIIINLAAAHRDDVRPISLYHDVNVTGAENICKAAEKNNINTLIFTSSVAVYALNANTPDEQTPPVPYHPYGQTKWEAEGVYQAWAAKDPARQLLIVRPTVIFGPNNRGNVYNLMSQIANKRFVMIGKGLNRKSLCYVENVSHFILSKLPQKPGVTLYNYVDKPDWDTKSLVSFIRERLGFTTGTGISLPYWFGYVAGFGFDVLARITGKNFPISRIRIEKFCANTVFAAEKAHTSGFKPKADLKAALATTIDHEFKKK